MTKLLMLKGLPASGKTTRAKELEQEGWTRVNKDDIRAQFFPDYTQKDEKDVIEIEDAEIIANLRDGIDTVIDDTNFNPAHKARFQKYAKDAEATFSEEFIDTPVEDCIRRNRKRGGKVPMEAIISMYDKYLAKEKNETQEYDDELEECIVIDIDGTLAHISGDNPRDPYDASRAMEDILDDAVSVTAAMYHSHGYRIVILTGRHGGHLAVTKEWLAKNDVNYDAIYCRKEGDNRPDYEVKEELFDRHVKGSYNVKFILDDRPAVCRMWRRKGLKTFQVGNPHYEF